MGKYCLRNPSPRLKLSLKVYGQLVLGIWVKSLRGLIEGSSGTAPVAASPVSDPEATSAAEKTAASASGEKHAAMKTVPTPLRLMPYVTLGLSRDEVISAQGEPTSSTNDKLMYNESELDLKDGKVVGWKIDPRSPLRVKLWPERPLDTSLRVFTVGSTRDEVLVVEGTPTSFSQDRFDYGSSVVYFRDGRVIAWKNGPGSVPLRGEQ